MRSPLQKDKRHRLLLLFVAIIVLALGILAIVVPPAVDYDSCWGFLVMHNMEQGHPFNLLISPADDNIAKNQTEFLTWWTPGQYIVPYFFKTLLKISTGQAASITIMVCDLIGLAGFYKLFTKLGFSKWVAAISIAFILTQQVFVQQFIYYHGSELILFAFMGWFLYGCFSVKKITWLVLVMLLLAGPVGFFAKSSFLWIYAAGIACVWINVSVNQSPVMSGTKALDNKRLKVWLLNGSLLAFSFICGFLIIYFCFLSKGPNPTSETAGFLVKFETFGFPLSSPMLSAFSVDELTGGLIYQPENTAFSYPLAVVILLVLTFCSLAFIAIMIKYPVDKKYAIAKVIFYLFSVVFFSLIYFEQANISYEGRHFRILGLLATPGLVYLFFKSKVTKTLFFVIWIGIIAMEFSYFRGKYKANIQASRNISGFSQPAYDNLTLTAITKLDEDGQTDAIFVLMGPGVAMEIKNKRRIIIDEGNMVDKDFMNMKYPGKAGPLYIIMPASYLKDGKSAMVTKSFTGYHQFAVKQLSSKYYLYTGIPPAP